MARVDACIIQDRREKEVQVSEVKEEKEVNAAKEENKMGVMPVNKLLINMGLPMIISMLVQACYNVVDSIFVARIADGSAVAGEAGTAALIAVGMAFPFQMLMIAFANGTAVGMNAILSRALGAKDRDRVRKASTNGVFMMGVCYILFLIVGIFFSRMLIESQEGAGLALEYGTDYLTIVMTGSIGIFTQISCERLLQSTGKTFYAMISQLVGAVINIIMDPILIFGLFGFPEMKVAGAAVATIMGQIIAAIVGIVLNKKKNPEVELTFKGFRPDWKIIRNIYIVGFPSIIMQAIGSVMTFTMNKILAGLNPDSVAVFTVYFKLQSLFFMPIFGLNNATIPIIAFNFGAGKRKRLLKAYRLSLVYAFLFMLLGFLAFELFPEVLLRLFDTGAASLIELGVPALRIIGVHFLIAGYCICTGSTFQALGNGLYSLIVSVARQLVVLIPAAYILAEIGGLPTVWWCFPVAEIMSAAATVFFFFRINKKIIRHIPDNE